MRRRLAVVVLVTACSGLVLVTACSSEAVSDRGERADGGATASAANDGNAATSGSSSGSSSGFAGFNCAPKTAGLSGTIDGTTIDVTYASAGPSLANSRWVGPFGTGGELAVKTSNKGCRQPPCFVNATITMPTEGPLAGQSFCTQDGFFEVKRPTDGGSCDGACGFEFRGYNLQLGKDMDGGTCLGAAIDGAVNGCVGGEN